MYHNPDLVRAIQLLDHVKLRGFTFHSDATETGGPLVGTRISDEWADTIHREGFTRDCAAWRHRVDGDDLAQHRLEGSALTVLTEALTWDMGTLRITKRESHEKRRSQCTARRGLRNHRCVVTTGSLMPMNNQGLPAQQISHKPLCQILRGARRHRGPCPDRSTGDWSVLPDRPLLRWRPARVSAE